MPTSRQLPSWIRPADPLRYFLPAFQAASSAAQARARLQQAAQQSSVEAGLRSRQIDEQAALRKQEMAVEAQDREIRLGLEARRLEDVERKNAEQAKWAWQKWEEGKQEREIQRQFAQAQQQRSLDAAAERQQVGIEARKVQLPEDYHAEPVRDETGKVIPGMHLYRTPSGWTTREDPGYVGAQAGQRTEKFHATQNRIAKLKADRSEILKRQDFSREPKNENLKRIWQTDKGQLDAINRELDQLAPALQGATTATGTTRGRKAPPAVGTVMDGYEFLGGNPADQANWRKVQADEEPDEEPAPDEEE